MRRAGMWLSIPECDARGCGYPFLYSTRVGVAMHSCIRRSAQVLHAAKAEDMLAFAAAFDRADVAECVLRARFAYTFPVLVAIRHVLTHMHHVTAGTSRSSAAHCTTCTGACVWDTV